MKKRLIFALFVALAMAFCITLTFAAERATLYINDTEWEEDSILPFIESNGRMLVPAVAFSKLSDIKITFSEMLGSLLIESEDAFLSVNLNFGTSLDEKGEKKECEVFRYGGQIYLEPTEVCEKFGLLFETAYAPDGYLTARLCDTRATLEFSDLLSSYTEDADESVPYLYNPTGKTVAGSFVHPILLIPSPINVSAAIELLGDNCVTFAISPKEIERYGEVLPMIYANGHTLAYYLDVATVLNVDEFSSDMAKANRYLFSMLGKTARIYVCTEEPAKIPQIDGYFAKACRLHLLADDLRSNRMITSALINGPVAGSYNFSLASDRGTRSYYSYFFTRLDSYEILRSMPLKESSSVQ